MNLCTFRGKEAMAFITFFRGYVTQEKSKHLDISKRT